MAKYKIGQIVKLDVPAAYGVVSGFLGEADLGYTNECIKNPALLYKKGDVIIDVLIWQDGIEDGVLMPTAYRLSDPFFAGAIHAINPSEELRTLRSAQSRGNARLNGIDLETAIYFLRGFADKGQNTRASDQSH